MHAIINTSFLVPFPHSSISHLWSKYCNRLKWLHKLKLSIPERHSDGQRGTLLVFSHLSISPEGSLITSINTKKNMLRTQLIAVATSLTDSVFALQFLFQRNRWKRRCIQSAVLWDMSLWSPHGKERMGQFHLSTSPRVYTLKQPLTIN